MLGQLAYALQGLEHLPGGGLLTCTIPIPHPGVANFRPAVGADTHQFAGKQSDGAWPAPAARFGFVDDHHGQTLGRMPWCRQNVQPQFTQIQPCFFRQPVHRNRFQTHRMRATWPRGWQTERHTQLRSQQPGPGNMIGVIVRFKNCQNLQSLISCHVQIAPIVAGGINHDRQPLCGAAQQIARV